MWNITYPINSFNSFLSDLKRLKKTFTVEIEGNRRTVTLSTECKKIKFCRNQRKDINEDTLIRFVKKDTDAFLKNNSEALNESSATFSRVLKIPNQRKLLSRVDIDSAYWQNALLRGIISDKTNDLLHRLYEKMLDNTSQINILNKDEYERKLKIIAMGSLASRKVIQIYENALLVNTTTEISKTQKLYLDIRNQVNSLMVEAAYYIPDTYCYYWDSIFVDSRSKSDCIKFFKNRGYETKVNGVRMITLNNANIYFPLTLTQ
jgi:hypothetical protein